MNDFFPKVDKRKGEDSSSPFSSLVLVPGVFPLLLEPGPRINLAAIAATKQPVDRAHVRLLAEREALCLLFSKLDNDSRHDTGPFYMLA